MPKAEATVYVDVLNLEEVKSMMQDAATEIAALRAVAAALADALRFHEDRRANPTSRGGPALARYDALMRQHDGSGGGSDQ